MSSRSIDPRFCEGAYLRDGERLLRVELVELDGPGGVRVLIEDCATLDLRCWTATEVSRTVLVRAASQAA